MASCIDATEELYVEWKNGATSDQFVAGGNGVENQNNQFNTPINMIVDKSSDSLIICDSDNKRVTRWPCGNGTSEEIMISNVAYWSFTIDNDGYLYISDVNKQEVRRWKIVETNGTVVAGGNDQGNSLNQPWHIFVDQDLSIYVLDHENHRVMKWMKDAKEEILVAGDHGQGNSLRQLSYPQGIIVDQLGTLYVADFSNHRVMRWFKGATEGSVVGDENDGQGEQLNPFYYPVSLSFDRQSNLYVLQFNNYRAQKFNIEPNSN